MKRARDRWNGDLEKDLNLSCPVHACRLQDFRRNPLMAAENSHMMERLKPDHDGNQEKVYSRAEVAQKPSSYGGCRYSVV